MTKSPDQQAVFTDANGNVSIQIIGDNNSVKLDVGTPRLLLELPVPSPLPDKTDSAYTELKLLSPYAKDFPYRGSVQFLDDMKAFLRADKSVAARLVIGPGGRGKTRLALELCRHAREAGWEAGFAASEKIRDLAGRMGRPHWNKDILWNKDTLVIVDYASLVTKELREWFRYLMEYAQSEPSQKLRIVLLERHGSRDIGWWSELVSLGSWQNCDLDAILDSREPLSLPALTDPVEQIRVMQDTLKASGRSFTLSEQDDKLHQALDKMEWAAQPLYLKMAALCMQAENSVPVLGKAELAYELAGREGSMLGEVAEGKGAEGVFAKHMAAYATLTRGLTKKQYRKAMKEESSELGCSLPPLDFLSLLQERLPGNEEDDIGELLPDVVGEAFILRYLDGQDACLRAYVMKPLEVVATLVRCVQHVSYLSDSKTANNPLHWLDAIYHSIRDNQEKLEALATLLPERTTALRQLAVNVTEDLVTLQRQKEGNDSELARLLNNLSVFYSYLDHRKEALKAAEEAVRIRTTLAEKHPGAIEPDLAMSLNNLANIYSDLDRHEDALEAAEQSRSLYSALTGKDFDAFEPDLAMSLNNLANIYSDLALKAAEQARSLYGALVAGEDPEAFAPDSAMFLNTPANIYSALALKAAEQAVEICKILSEKYPEAFEPYLATYLSNLANRYSDLKRHKDAVKAAEQAVEICKTLTEKHPEAFEPYLATYLNNLASSYFDLGCRESALKAVEESIILRGKLKNLYGELFAQDFMYSLLAFILVFSGKDLKEEAARFCMDSIRSHVIEKNSASEITDRTLHVLCLGYPIFCQICGQEPEEKILQFCASLDG